MTNAEKLAQNVDDMAVAIAKGTCDYCACFEDEMCMVCGGEGAEDGEKVCIAGIKKWLEQEAEA